MMVDGAEGKAMAGEHGADGLGMTLRKPKPLGMFIHHKDIAIAILAGEEHHGVVRETIVQSGPPFHGPCCGEVGDDVHFAAEGGEELACRDVPVSVEPGASLPSRE